MKYTFTGFFIALFVATAFIPHVAFALSLESIADPFCVFRDCDDEVRNVNYVNSNNVNSNVNSPGGVVSGNSAIIVSPSVLTNTDSNSNSNVDSNYDFGQLGVSCSSGTATSFVGRTVIWNASAWGGNGNYSYSWSGSEGLSDSGSSASIRYDRTGAKTAQVRVTSGGRSVTQTCSHSILVYNSSSDYYDDYDYDYDYDDDYDNDDDLSVKCTVDDRTVKVGESVRYEADADGGSGSYRYEWDGSDGFSDTGRTTRVEYDYPGTYRMEVEVRSGGQYETRSCPTVRVEDDNDSDRYYTTQRVSTTYNGDLTASCTADRTSANSGVPVTWMVYPRGGNGSYAYAWSGSDALQSNRDSVVTGYYTQGLKSANVTVYSAGRQITVACGSVSITGSAVRGGTVSPSNGTKSGTTDVKPADKETLTGAMSALGAASILSLKNAPWGSVSILVILVLLGTIFYMIYNKNKL